MTDASSQHMGYALRLQTGALLVALISAGAFISVPIPGSPVPIVLQNMFVILAGLVLPAGWAALTVGVYLLLGAVGLPVFAGATGGLAHLAGPTGGFLMGFPIGAAVAAAVIHGGGNRSVAHAGFLRQTLALAAGFLIIYATGVPWLAITADLSLGQAATLGMLPFIPGDIMKAAVLILLVRTVPRAIWQTLK